MLLLLSSHAAMIVLLIYSFFVIAVHATTSGGGRGRGGTGGGNTQQQILVVGSANADTFLPLSRLPTEGENLTLLPGQHPIIDVPGGKGCTQAVAAARLSIADNDCNNNDKNRRVAFWGQLGDDTAGQILQDALDKSNVQHRAFCGIHKDVPTGRGYVFWVSSTGSVSAVVSGGSNTDGWIGWEDAWNSRNKRRKNGGDDLTAKSSSASTTTPVEEEIRRRLKGIECIMLQREVPEYVNLLIADIAKEINPDVIVVQDIGGEDRPISSQMLKLCDFVIPNVPELLRLVWKNAQLNDDIDDDYDIILEAAKDLQQQGASNVLVTRGSKGSVLLTEDGEIIQQPAIPVHGKVVDETGAGDCFRAAFCVALLERHHALKDCLLFASAAGSCSVEVHGAVPSAPSRSNVLDRLVDATVMSIPRGDGQSDTATPHSVRGGGIQKTIDDENNGSFPFLIGSRLNSMKDRPELWEGPLDNPRDFVRRQATISGLSCVDFNYPQHFHTWSANEAKQALDEAGLVAGAVCLRYPSKFARGAMNHPDPALRREAIQLTKEAAQAASLLGCDEVVVWSAYDGCKCYYR
jgi:ribokinase